MLIIITVYYYYLLLLLLLLVLSSKRGSMFISTGRGSGHHGWLAQLWKQKIWSFGCTDEKSHTTPETSNAGFYTHGRCWHKCIQCIYGRVFHWTWLFFFVRENETHTLSDMHTCEQDSSSIWKLQRYSFYLHNVNNISI